MKILYLGGVGPFGGASRSLYEAVKALPDGRVLAYFLMPRGTAINFYRRVAEDVIAIEGATRFDHTRVTYYRGLRWLVVLRELWHFPFMIAGLIRALIRWKKVDIIHVNEVTEVIFGICAKLFFKVPMVIHVRSLVHADRRLLRTRFLHHLLRKYADAIIAIDGNVRASLPEDLDVQIIHNSFTKDPVELEDHVYFEKFKTLRPRSLKVGFVGNIFRTKGVIELVQAARLVKDAGGDVQFIIVGGATAKLSGFWPAALRSVGLANNAMDTLSSMISEFELEDDFLMLGPTADIQRVYPRMDVLAFPSHLDACGRPVFEAAFFGVPSIVAVSNPADDTLIHGQTGLAIPRPDPELVADAVMWFERNRPEVQRMGANARRLAESNFAPSANALRLFEIYRKALRI